MNAGCWILDNENPKVTRIYLLFLFISKAIGQSGACWASYCTRIEAAGSVMDKAIVLLISH